MGRSIARARSRLDDEPKRHLPRYQVVVEFSPVRPRVECDRAATFLLALSGRNTVITIDFIHLLQPLPLDLLTSIPTQALPHDVVVP